MKAHGTHAAYKSGCRCRDCRAAAAAYERGRKAGHRILVPADEVKCHIAFLMERGMSAKSIADAAGLSFYGVSRLARGTTERSKPGTVAALLAVIPSDTPPGHRIKANRARVLIDEMYRAGITQRQICTWLGMESPWVYFARDTWIMSKTWRRVRVLYELLARQGVVPASVLEEVS